MTGSTNSRFAICAVGEGFSVEDRRTGKRISYHRTWGEATKEAKRLNTHMPQAYSNPERESDEYALPDIEVFQLNAHEVAALDEDMVHEYMKRHEFRLASMNSKVREAMFDAMIEEECIRSGWFYWYCFPGCIPDSSPFGPYDTYAKALAAAQEDAAE